MKRQLAKTIHNEAMLDFVLKNIKKTEGGRLADSEAQVPSVPLTYSNFKVPLGTEYQRASHKFQKYGPFSH